MITVRIVPPLFAALGLVLALLAAPPVLAHPPGVTQRVSVGPAGAAGDADSQLPAISANGRYVAFWSFEIGRASCRERV